MNAEQIRRNMYNETGLNLNNLYEDGIPLYNIKNNDIRNMRSEYRIQNYIPRKKNMKSMDDYEKKQYIKKCRTNAYKICIDYIKKTNENPA